MLKKLRFDGAPVLVTGAGTGIGQACCQVLAELGASVVMVGRTEETLRETERLIAGTGVETMCLTADVTREDAVAGLTQACLDRFGRIDILHNNVGGQGTGRALSAITLDDWNETFARNATSVMLTCHAAVPIMERQGGGAIVNISSVASIRHLGVPTAVYSAVKGAVNQFTRNIAIQYAKKGIRANCVLPGYIDTPFIRRNVGGRKSYELKGFKSAEEYGAARDAVVPLGRMGTAWDVANAALFLASDDASYITGIELVVDGGVTATCPGV